MIVIRRGSNRLYLYKGDEAVARLRRRHRPVLYPTPLGRFHDRGQVAEPVVVPARLAVGGGREAGPARARATRSARAGWALGLAGVGIHGTPDAASIGYSASHGCIRMHITDAEWLFNHVDVGTPVFIVSA